MGLLKAFFSFILDFYRNKRLIKDLVKKDFQQRYVGNFLGVLWAFIQPSITIFIFWFVFQVGFKSKPVGDFPFVLWLCCGMFPWFFFSDGINSATGSIVGNAYLVKKVVFRISLLPIVQIFSAFVVHSFFVCVLFIMFALYGYLPNLYNLQVIYYDFALFCLLFGLSLITSTLVVFLKDISQFVGMCLQFGFWGTPIFWDLNIMPAKYQWLFKCNPMYYIVNGYRDTFINHVWFWERGWTTIGFWLTTAFFMLIGVYLFKKMRPHFADVI